MSVKVRVRNGMAPDSGVGGVSEGDLRGPSTDFVEQSAGIVDVDGGMGLVHEASSPSMNVVVDAGVVYIPNDSFDSTDSDSVKFWEAVIAGNTAARTIAIASNSSGQTRIDLICTKIDPGEAPDEEASDVAQLIRVAGTPGSGVPATPDYHVAHAKVTVANGETEITNAEITDLREQLTFKNAFIPDLEGKRLTKRIVAITSSSTPTPDSDVTDEYKITALAANATFGAPTGTPTEGQGLIVRIKDNGTARTLAFNSGSGGYRAMGVDLPTTTVINKTMYLGFIYNATDSKWDFVALAQES